MSLLAEDVHKSYGELEVLRGVTFSVDPGQVKVIIGPSGSGKSTLLRCLAVLEQPESGTVSLDGRRPTRIVTSPERKARETAEILAETLRVPLDEDRALREHERPDLPFLDEPAEFESRMRIAFERPAERLFGGESVAGAVDRFAAGIASQREAHPGDSLAVVSHGTVISGFVARVAGVDAFALWRSLALPSWIDLDVEGARVVDGWRAAWSDGGRDPRTP